MIRWKSLLQRALTKRQYLGGRTIGCRGCRWNQQRPWCCRVALRSLYALPQYSLLTQQEPKEFYGRLEPAKGPLGKHQALRIYFLVKPNWMHWDTELTRRHWSTDAFSLIATTCCGLKRKLSFVPASNDRAGLVSGPSIGPVRLFKGLNYFKLYRCDRLPFRGLQNLWWFRARQMDTQSQADQTAVSILL